MTRPEFHYEGEVVLGCQEGGYAAPEIRLADLPGGQPQGVTAKGRVLFSGGWQPKTLDEVLRETFGSTELNDFGDEAVGRLHIRIERVDS